MAVSINLLLIPSASYHVGSGNVNIICFPF